MYPSCLHDELKQDTSPNTKQHPIHSSFPLPSSSPPLTVSSTFPLGWPLHLYFPLISVKSCGLNNKIWLAAALVFLLLTCWIAFLPHNPPPLLLLTHRNCSLLSLIKSKTQARLCKHSYKPLYWPCPLLQTITAVFCAIAWHFLSHLYSNQPEVLPFLQTSAWPICQMAAFIFRCLNY